MRSIIQNVEVIRQHKGITKKKMAHDAGISYMAATRVLTGETRCTPEILYSFAVTLGVDDMNVFFSEKLTESVISKRELTFASTS